MNNPLSSLLAGKPKEGKVPPQDLAMEQAVLGAIMIESSAYGKVADTLKTEMFYKEGHRVIYAAAGALYDNNKPIDLLTVKSMLQTQGKLETAGGIFYLTELMGRVAGGSNVVHHAIVIRQKHVAREIIKACDEYSIKAFDETQDPLQLLEDLTGRIGLIEPGIEGDVTFSDAVVKAEETVEKIDKGELKLVPCAPFMSGLTFLPGELIVIAADSGTGKTSTAMQWALHLDAHGFYGSFSSLEMSPEALAMGQMSKEAKVNGFRFRQGGLSIEQWQAWEPLKKVKRMMVVKARTTAEVRRKVRKIRKDNKVKPNDPVYIVMDYFQLMAGEGGSSEEKLARIGHELKEIMVDENAIGILLAQLNREWLKYNPKKPGAHNIRSCDAVRHDADFVFLLYRPELVGIDRFEDGMSTTDIGVCMMGKSRIGTPPEMKDKEFRCRIVSGKWMPEGYQPPVEQLFPDPNRVRRDWIKDDNDDERRFAGWD